jgi:hypothetical protein
MKDAALQYRKGFEQPLMVFLGPLIGSLVVVAAFAMLFRGQLWGEALFFGYFLGLPPAISTAIAYGLLVRRAAADVPRPSLAAFLGGFFSFLEVALGFIPRGTMVLSADMMTGELLMFATVIGGAVAAFVCTYLGRRELYR